MSYEKTIDVTIDNHRYQIGQFKATDGSWVLTQILTKLMPAVIEKALAQKAGAPLPGNRTSLSEDEFATLQAHALAVVRRYEKDLPVPIFVRPNRWTATAKDLEYDLSVVMALTANAIVHNVLPFFSGGGLLRLLDSIPGFKAAPSSPDTKA